jgi:hypothetical protein
MEWAHQSPRFWFGIWGRHATAVEIFMGPVQGRGGQISDLCLRVHRGLSKNRTPDTFSGLHQTRFRYFGRNLRTRFRAYYLYPVFGPTIYILGWGGA